jgi:uncharacterized membrane protein SirB2
MLDTGIPLDLRIPHHVLVALTSQPIHRALQPISGVLQALHLTSMAVFLGAIVVLDLRLIGIRSQITLEGLSSLVLPVVRSSFLIVALTGVALFLYSPMVAGMSPWFVPKLLLVVVGLVNAWCYQRRAERPDGVTARARFAGTISLVTWVGVAMLASLTLGHAARGLMR